MTMLASNETIITTTRMSAIARVFLFIGFLLPFKNLLNALLCLGARQHHLMAAAGASELHVHAHARDLKDLFAAGVPAFSFRPCHGA